MSHRLLFPCALLCAVGCAGFGAPSPAASVPCVVAPPPPASPATSLARPPDPPPPAKFEVAAVDEYIAGQMAAQGFVGLSVAIVKDGVAVLAKGYGRSQLAPDLPTQADTPFALASITKQFVSSLVLQLAEEKKLSLDDKVAKYFPDLTRASDITLYDLMTHVSGYRDNYPLDFVDREMQAPVTPDEILARYAKRPLDFEPRTRFSYSSTGYKILGRVIEKVTGKRLGVVLDERIFRPLGMAHSSYMPTEGSPGLARGYTSFALGPPEPAAPEAHDWGFGGSGIFAPAGDIAKWDIALMTGKVLGPEAYKTFTAPRHLADGRTSVYGCGIISWTRGGEAVLQHGGADSGFRGASTMLPRTQSAVIVLSNRDDADPAKLVDDIVALLNKEHRPPPLKVDGPPAKEVARAMLAAMQSGRVDRHLLGEDFNLFLTDAKLRGANARLGPLGAPTQVDVESTQERGGMEQTSILFSFGTMKLGATMFRSVNGKVEQFLVSRP